MKSSTIEFFARPVERTFGLAQHLYILSTDSQGHQKIWAGPETDTGMLTDDLKVVYTDYIKENQDLFKGDWDSEGNHVKVYKVTGTDLEVQNKMEKMWEIGRQINSGNYDYKHMDKFVLSAIDTLKEMQNKISNNSSGLGNFIKQSKERLEQFSFNKSKHYSAGENI